MNEKKKSALQIGAKHLEVNLFSVKVLSNNRPQVTSSVTSRVCKIKLRWKE